MALLYNKYPLKCNILLGWALFMVAYDECSNLVVKINVIIKNTLKAYKFQRFDFKDTYLLYLNVLITGDKRIWSPTHEELCDPVHSWYPADRS